MKGVTCIPIGTEVLIGDDIPATIVRVALHTQEHLRTYECEWWSDRRRHSDWFSPWQLKVPPSTRLKSIGFVTDVRTEEGSSS